MPQGAQSSNSSSSSDTCVPLLTSTSPLHAQQSAIFSGNATLPPINEPIDYSAAGWEVIEEDFTMIWLLQTSHASSTIHSSPTSRLDDGVFTILYTTNCSTFDLLQLLVLADTGQHINHPQMKKRTCVAFRFEPKNIDDGGIFALDGELVDYGTIQGTVLPSAARTLSL